MCGEGKRQSSIDIPSSTTGSASFAERSYGASRLTISHHEHVADIIDNGHTIQVSREAEKERELVDTGAESRYGTYFSTLFRFKVGAREGGVLGLLWIREDGFWRIVSYEAFAQ